MIRLCFVLFLLTPGSLLAQSGERIRTRMLPPANGEQHPTYETEVDFVDPRGLGRTGWTIRWQTAPVSTFRNTVENFVLREVTFKNWPKGERIKVLSRAELMETAVMYSRGPRYYDIADGNGLLQLLATDLGPHSQVLDKERKVAAELRDRGLVWKARDASRRGQELVLWSTFKASNYYYVVEYRFADDGTIQMRLGSTGHNLTKDRHHAHMHLAYWRIDVDLGGQKPNLVWMTRHLEPADGMGSSKQSVELLESEGGHEWNPREFTTWRVTNPAKRNEAGNPIGYELFVSRTGVARHYGPSAKEKMEEKDLPDEKYTHFDFWVTQFDGKHRNFMELPKYSQARKPLREDSDVVLWCVSTAHHVPRDEDLIGPINQREPAATQVVWSGIDLKPRDLMASTPFFALDQR